MASNEEKMQVLKMVEEGKISAEDAADLLQAIEIGEKKSASSQENHSAGPSFSVHEPHWIRVRVSDIVSGKSNVNIRLPLGMVRAGMKMGMKFSPEMKSLDMEEVMDLIRSGQLGKIVDVYDDNDNEHVEVFLE